MKNKLLHKIFSLLISIIDYVNKKKIILFFKKTFKKKYINVIDIGAHKGETIDFLLKNFNINTIYSFEPNSDLFLNIKKITKYQNSKIKIFNIGLGDKKEIKELKVMLDSSSSTFNTINEESNYFKRKQKIFSYFFKKQQFIKEYQKIEIDKLSNIINKNKIGEIDLLKIDTEGYEYNVLRGIDDIDFKKINFIYFEHHYDLMIQKGYKYSDINSLLKRKNFYLKYKIKMKLRKSFEYVYENSKK